MRTIRRAVREELDLPVLMRLQGEAGPSTFRGRTVDLSETGVGVILNRAVEPGTAVSVAIQDILSGRNRERIWRGEVVFDRSEREGRRLGVSFLDDIDAYTERFQTTATGDRGRSFRLDGCRAEEPDEPEIPGQSWLKAMTMGGFGVGMLAEMLTSNDLARLVATDRGTGSASDLTALVGLGCVGLLDRLGRSSALDNRPEARAGLGLAMGGLVGELARQMALGAGRPVWLWPSAITQILAVGGVALTLGSFLRTRTDREDRRRDDS